MKFRSTLSHKVSPLQISHKDRLLALGSCFADRIGGRLKANKFSIEVNPLGISYNPVSLFHHVKWAMGHAQLAELRFQESRETWHSFDLHSNMSRPDKEGLEENLRNLQKDLKAYLEGLDVLVLSFGTARVYRRKDTGEIVANNHGYPASFFQRELLSPQELLSNSEEALKLLREARPNLQVLLTVSPIRHIRDGLEENSLSKSHLRMYCHVLKEAYSFVHYFPAFELMMDDLRDYRFYEEDLIHPNTMAENYIWEVFAQRHFGEETRVLVEKIVAIRKDLAHKPFRPTSVSYQKFLQALIDKIDALPSEISFMEEKNSLLKKLEKWN